MHVLLMGLRGSGKTTVGGLLAERLGCPFIDLDQRVLATFAESTVTAVWATHGEDAWRAAEATTLDELLATTSPDVIAMGGGTPMIESVSAALATARTAGTATVVYLRCTARELQRRLAGETDDRPSLTGADPAIESEAVLATREPVYRTLADHEYDVTTTTPQDAADSLQQLMVG